MPRLFRSMYEEEGRPSVGVEANKLGVRVAPPGERADVHPDADGKVAPGEGMSVAPHWKRLPPGLIPERLKEIAPKARGENALKCFRHGQGTFIHGPVAAGLVFAVDQKKKTHGIVEPEQRIAVASFQDALAATQSDWQVDEEDEAT